jgi:hypothetical protein
MEKTSNNIKLIFIIISYIVILSLLSSGIVLLVLGVMPLTRIILKIFLDNSILSVLYVGLKWLILNVIFVNFCNTLFKKVKIEEKYKNWTNPVLITISYIILFVMNYNLLNSIMMIDKIPGIIAITINVLMVGIEEVRSTKKIWNIETRLKDKILIILYAIISSPLSMLILQIVKSKI